MKRLILFFSFLPGCLSAQVHYSFETGILGSWEQVPSNRWEVSSTEPISGHFSLHHNYDNSGIGCDYLLLRHDPVSMVDTLTLSFRVRHGYPPSSANNWQVILLGDLSGALMASGQVSEGIVVGVNFEGSDDLIKIWQCTEGQCTELCSTHLNYQEKAGTKEAAFFSLKLYPGGELQLYYSVDSGLVEQLEIESCVLTGTPAGRVLAVRYQYSPTQDRKLWLDDIIMEGSFIPDRKSPEVLGIEVPDSATVVVDMSEPVIRPATSSFHLNEMLQPDSIIVKGSEIMLRFQPVIPNRHEQFIKISGLCDPDGNCLSDTTIGFIRNVTEWGDVVINEIMFDPAPPVYLPDCEYLELLNRSDWEIDLKGWQVCVDGLSYEIKEMQLAPGEFGLLLPSGCSGYRRRNHAAIFTSEHALPNDGATVTLVTKQGGLIHVTRYEPTYTNPEWKREGGWSLESPDPEQLCMTLGSWEYSESESGGTPGEGNSVNEIRFDTDPPRFLYCGYSEDGELILTFSEMILFASLRTNLMKVQPGNNRPESILPGAPFFDHLVVRFEEQTREHVKGELIIPSVSDCSGNWSGEIRLPLGKISRPVNGSVVINEVMYDPMDGVPEFIELYNPGSQFYDLKDMTISIVKEGAPASEMLPLCEASRLIPPGEMVVLCQNCKTLIEAYGLENGDNLVEPGKLSQMNNSGGTLYLADRSGSTVDVMSYADDMHVALLHDTRGISLERIRIDRSGTDPDNWHSAASIEGYATPGQKNSQAAPEGQADELLHVDPVVFSPNNDGFQDLLQIRLSPRQQGVVIRIRITDLNGNPVRTLANNHISGAESIYFWDGECDNGEMAEMGIYVIHVTGYNTGSGGSWRRRRSVGVIYR